MVKEQAEQNMCRKGVHYKRDDHHSHQFADGWGISILRPRRSVRHLVGSRESAKCEHSLQIRNDHIEYSTRHTTGQRPETEL